VLDQRGQLSGDALTDAMVESTPGEANSELLRLASLN
jgi:hypothetical protein